MEIDELKSIIGQPEQDWVADFEIAAEEYYRQHGLAAVVPLMGLLSDQLPDEVNFALIHIIEETPSTEYAKALIDHLCNATQHDQYWLNILHFRVFNSAPDLSAYVQALKSTDATQKQIVARYLDGLIADPRNAKFLPQVTLLQRIAN